MTVLNTNQLSREYTGDGSTTIFGLNSYSGDTITGITFFFKSEIEVKVNNVKKILGTDYTITSDPAPTNLPGRIVNANVVFTTAPAQDDVILFSFTGFPAQLQSFTTGQGPDPESLEYTLDILTVNAQSNSKKYDEIIESMDIDNNFINGNSVAIDGGQNISTNAQSVFIGQNAGSKYGTVLTTGTPGAVHIGQNAGRNLVQDTSSSNGSASGLQNVSIGRNTLFHANHAYFCTVAGANAGFNVTTGKALTLLGHQNSANLVNSVDHTSTGEGGFGYLITGNGNTGHGVNHGLYTGLDYVGREYQKAGKLTTVSKDSDRFPTPANYYKTCKTNSFYGPGAGFFSSGDNNTALGTSAMFGFLEDDPVISATANTITLSSRAVPEDGFYVPAPNSGYAFAIITGTGGGSVPGDTYYNGGSAWLDWPANTSVSIGNRRVVERVSPSNGQTYRWMIVSKSTRTTRATFDATEEANWTYVAIEFDNGSDVKYFQVGVPTAYVGSTRTATIEVDGGGWHTVPDATSKYRYTPAPHRFKVPNINSDYDGFNNTVIGGTSQFNFNEQQHTTTVGWGSASNLSGGSYLDAFGAYAGNTDSSGNDVTTISNATVIGNRAVTRGNNTMVLGGPAQTVVLNDGTAVTSDARQKTDINEIPQEFGLEFVSQLPLFEFRYDKDQSYLEVDEETGKTIKHPKDGSKAGKRKWLGTTAQELKKTVEKVGRSTDDYSMYIDYSKSGGVDELAIREAQIPYCNSLAIQQLLKKVEDLEKEVKHLKEVSQ